MTAHDAIIGLHVKEILIMDILFAKFQLFLPNIRPIQPILSWEIAISEGYLATFILSKIKPQLQNIIMPQLFHPLSEEGDFPLCPSRNWSKERYDAAGRVLHSHEKIKSSCTGYDVLALLCPDVCGCCPVFTSIQLYYK